MTIHAFRNYSDCAEAWAHQGQDYGKACGERMYFRGDTIYSYGSHFPIARIVGDVVLFTVHDYSNTTAGHKAHVRGALRYSYRTVFHVAKVSASGEEHNDNMRSYAGRVYELVSRAIKAVKYGESYWDQAEALTKEANEYARIFGLKLRVFMPARPERLRDLAKTLKLGTILAGEDSYPLIKEAA